MVFHPASNIEVLFRQFKRNLLLQEVCPYHLIRLVFQPHWAWIISRKPCSNMREFKELLLVLAPRVFRSL
jgi:hypothetical protein